jgi:hypothetical protein
MSEALKKAVTEMQAARDKVNGEANTKVTKYGAFAKKFKELDRVKTERDFDKKKKECSAQLKGSVDAAAAQWKSTGDWETKIKAAKEKLVEEQQALAEFKKQWNEKIEKANKHNHIVDQLNPPGPETEKLKHKVDDKVTQWIIDSEREFLHLQHEINEEESAMNTSKQIQKLDRQMLERNLEKLTSKEFQAKKK